MRTSFIPSTDNGLRAFGLNFSTRISADPESFGLSSDHAAQFSAAFEAFSSSLAACTPAHRSKTLVMRKNQDRENLKIILRSLAGMVKSTLTVSASQKALLGLSVPSARVTVPPPQTKPVLKVVGVQGHTVKIRLHDLEVPRRGKPRGVSGATIFTFIGDEPPTNINDWDYRGSTTRASAEITFKSSIPPFTKVWLAACWFNTKAETGPTSDPVVTHLSYGITMAG